MTKFFALIRVKHYIKNLIIFLPPMLTLRLNDINVISANIKAFVIFSLVASIVYIFNDIKDLDSDRKHPLKSSRPLASGAVSIKAAIIVIIILAGVIIFLWERSNFAASYITWPLIYFALNILYSVRLKNIPLLDVIILSSCYVIRLFYGAAVNNSQVSNWVMLTMLSVSLFMGFGKRRNEFIQYGKSTRKSLKGYTTAFLDKSLQITLTSSIIFYSLMCADTNTLIARSGVNLLWTVPIIIIICLRYLMLVEDKECDGDPVSVITRDKALIILCSSYIASVVILLYK
ncbi:MAG: UbiA prenyltransferase family protein [Synergistaceae bacterium]|nr:UbiA prenyltransferase family protein [Synergistaceae bacterium]MBR0202933.1 UbiA prenyltransferase family protein [Synergistaceae bacterium]